MISYAKALQRYGDIPEGIYSGLQRYIEDGIPPGGFLTAVLENDLKLAVGRADMHSTRTLKNIVLFCCNEIPSYAWGSPVAVDQWLAETQRSHHVQAMREGAVEA